MNIIGLHYIKGTEPRHAFGYTFHLPGHWTVLYCVLASPDDPPVHCENGVLEVWTPYTRKVGETVNPRQLINYPRSTI